LSYGRNVVEGECMPRSQGTSQAVIPDRPHICWSISPPLGYSPSDG